MLSVVLARLEPVQTAAPLGPVHPGIITEHRKEGLLPARILLGILVWAWDSQSLVVWGPGRVVPSPLAALPSLC